MARTFYSEYGITRVSVDDPTEKGEDDNDGTKISAIFDRAYKKTEHGYEYIVLSKDTPQELMNEYMDFVMEQDEHCKNHKRIIFL